MSTPVDIRHSNLNAWNRCRRKAYIQYYMGYYRDSSAAAGIGTAVHSMLAEYYQPGYSSPDLATASGDALDHAVPMVATYIDEVERSGMDIGRRTVAVEQRLRTNSLSNGEIYGQVDWVFYDEEFDEYVLADHKTCRSFFETAPHDFQLLTYAALLHDNDITVSAAEHNMIKTNKRTARSKPPYVQRNRIEITEDMILKHKATLRHMMFDREQALHLAEISGLGVEHPVIWPIGKNDCSWSCDYVDVCGIISTGEDYLPVLQSEYVQQEAEPHE